MLRHKSLNFPWSTPASGEEVGICRSRDKKLTKASGLKGAVGRLLYVDLWGDGTCTLLKKGCDPNDPEFIRGLRPKSVSTNCILEGWNPQAVETVAKQWTTCSTGSHDTCSAEKRFQESDNL